MKATPVAQIKFIPIDQIKPNPWNRTVFDPVALEELAASIQAEGIREPLIVRLITSSPAAAGRGPKYQIASGNRRWLAAKKLGLETVPCLVESLSDEQVAEDNITMNIQREDIPPLELARMVQAYMAKFGKVQEEAAKTFGKDRTWVTKLLGFLKIDAKARHNVRALTLGWDALEAIKRLPPEAQQDITQELKQGKLPLNKIVKRCNQLRFGLHSKGGFQKEAPLKDPLAKEWETLRSKLLEAGSSLFWDVEYGHHKIPTGEKKAGWFFFAMPQESSEKEALAKWFLQMGKAMSGKKLEDPFTALQKEHQRDAENFAVAFNPRVPRTAQEEKELEGVAVRGTPKDVFEWIYGKDSPMMQMVPYASWKEAELAPKEGLKEILDGIKQFQNG